MESAVLFIGLGTGNEVGSQRGAEEFILKTKLLNPKPLNPESYISPKPETLNPKPQTRSPKPETLNPKP